MKQKMLGNSYSKKAAIGIVGLGYVGLHIGAAISGEWFPSYWF
jgi:UDP-N-acetyl-D-mannosaminuronate dehydrogenase